MKKISIVLYLLFLPIFPCCLLSQEINSFPYPEIKNPNVEQLKKETLENLKTFEGWCIPEKASAMMDLILATKPKVCVEIGVFGGSSVYPTLMALKHNQKGVLYAIDPWKNEEAVKNYESENIHAVWWGTVDLQRIFTGFIQNIQKYQVEKFCKIFRKTSEQAAAQIPKVDILHIDGNHSEAASVLDVVLYLPKVKVGGFIWFDDTNWGTTNKAVEILKEKCKLIYQYQDDNDAFALFEKTSL